MTIDPDEDCIWTQMDEPVLGNWPEIGSEGKRQDQTWFKTKFRYEHSVNGKLKSWKITPNTIMMCIFMDHYMIGY